MSHTPRPWRIDSDNILRGGDEKPILCLDGVSDADAQLIAAAPNMLEALERIELAVRTAYHISLVPAAIRQAKRRHESLSSLRVVDANIHYSHGSRLANANKACLSAGLGMLGNHSEG